MHRKIEKRLQANSGINLLNKNVERIIAADDEFLAALTDAKRNNAGPGEELLDFTVNALLEIIYGINQYLDIDSGSIEILKTIYRNTYESLDSPNPREALQMHYTKLSAWLSKFYPPEFVDALQNVTHIGKVENREYSAPLQLQILGIDGRAPAEPVLDIGCGKSALLVNALRENGIRAFGIDRMIQEKKDYLFACSWFDFDFFTQRWGTVIANMSFSNHFVHAIRNDKAKTEQFAGQYRRILESLELNGTFVYAPAVPFAERAIDSRFYRIEREIVYAGIARAKVTKLRE